MTEHTSYDLSKRLHEVGFRGEHTHVWVHHWNYKTEDMIWTLHPIDEDDKVNDQIPCYTFTELWSVLPAKVNDHWLEIHKGIHGENDLDYFDNDDNPRTNNPMVASIAECAGLMLEWLITEGHVQCDKKGVE